MAIDDFSRRRLLAVGASAAVLPSLGWSGAVLPKKRRALRVAYATDPHVQPERKGGEGWAACLKHIQAQEPRPDLVLTGGDMVFETLGATPERAKQLWDLFTKVTKDNLSLPIRYTIGNHDVFGWHSGDKYVSDPRYGKAWAREALGLQKTYYSFDQGGWHFIVLDSMTNSGGGYIAKLDEEQFEWLKADLEATPKTTPVVVSSHIPILMVCAIFDGQNEKSGDWVVPASYMHIDARRITDLFLKHPNVKLCLSGHEHQIDEVVFNGVTYFCAGAVCAGWWGGDYFQCTYGYALVDLFSDGTFEKQYVPFGWKTSS